MPIYEFYCEHCNTIFSFLSRRVVTDALPLCPKCKRNSLSKRMSRFAVVSKSAGEGDDGGEMDDLPFNESQLERAMAALEGDMDTIDENDPKALARFMRKFSSEAGMEFGEKMEDMLHRLEQGEDPQEIEAGMGEMEDDADLLDFFRKRVASGRTKPPPEVDETLYEM